VVLAVALMAGATACQDDPGPTSARPQTLPALSEQQAVDVWAVGDSTTESRATGRVVRLIKKADPDRIFYLGDVYEDYSDRFDATFGRAGLLDEVLPSAGNHEWPSQRDEYLAYWRKVKGRPVGPFYSTRMGGWQVLSLNTQEPMGPGSAQLRWLRRQLRGGGDCRLAFWHRPRWSAGDHGDQEDVAPLWRALKGRARLVLSGHDHDMQRFAPRGGITQLVSGAGGRSLYDVDVDRRLRFSNDRDYGALHLRLEPGVASFRFVTVDGRTLHSGRVRCTAG
jgi:hypothetical protein